MNSVTAGQTMRLPKARFTLRSMMVAMAVLACVCWFAERKLRFQRLAEYHALRSEADVIGCVTLMTDNGEPTFLVESATGTPTTPARRDWHRVRREKYEKAARSPWLSVAPDPPRPD
jgi:hypothetical protein